MRFSPKLPRAVLPCCDCLLPCFAPSGATGRGAWRAALASRVRPSICSENRFCMKQLTQIRFV